MNYLIDFKNSATQQEIDAYFASHGLTLIKTFNSFDRVYHVSANVEPPKTDLVDFLVRDDDSALQLLGTVVVADPTFGTIVTDGSLPTVNIPNDEQNWWKFYILSDPDLDAATVTINRRGSNSTVYVLDSGVNGSHPEFADSVVENLWSFNGNFTDMNGHGTAIASVITGKTCGMTNARIKSVKIFENGTPTRQSDLLAALDVIYADFVQNNFNSRHGNAIVNASWSIAKNEYIEHKIRMMLDAGIFFVTSAGNDGAPISDRTPASMPEVLTIGAFNNSLVPCDFSNYTGGSSIQVTGGPVNHGELDGWAPGEKIWAAMPNGSYAFTAGTSMAAAIVSGVLAYNIDSLYEPIYNTQLTNYFRSFALFRADLLDLSDPKYSSSVNGMATLREKMPPSFGRGIPVMTQAKGVEGSKLTLQMFSPWVVTQIDFTTGLPDFMEVTSAGKLYGKLPAMNPGERYRIVSLPMNVTFTDGQQQIQEFKLFVVANDFNSETESTGNPELDLVLAAQYFCASTTPCISPSDECINNCGMFLVCDQGICPNPKQLSCICIL